MGYEIDTTTTSVWPGSPFAIEHDVMLDSGDVEKVVMARHPTNPFVRKLRSVDGGRALDKVLIEVANAYLKAYRETTPKRDGVPQVVFDALIDGDDNGFRWLPLSWGESRYFVKDAADAAADPRGSFWVSRERHQGPPALLDRTAVLLASPHVERRASKRAPMGGGTGLRVVLHISESESDEVLVRVTGMSMSNLPETTLLNIPSGTLSPGLEIRVNLWRELLQSQFSLGELPAFQGVSVSGPSGKKTLRAFFSGQTSRRDGNPDGGGERSLRIVGEAAIVDEKAMDVTTLANSLSFSAVEEISRLGDPASRNGEAGMIRSRPTRRMLDLDDLTARVNAKKLEGKKLGSKYVMVLQSLFGARKATKTRIQRMENKGPPLRSDRGAALLAFLRCEEFFSRLEEFGLLPQSYFRVAKLPVLVRPRAALPGARDGEAVNAEVTPRGGSGVFYAAMRDFRSRVELRFGWAELARRAVVESDDNHWRAQPLGLAADPRWAWHEFGHVLNFAATGRLEFCFAHSAGDALAAITHDPESELTKPPRDRYRYRTFPWVQGSRQHGREADAGWCWSGERNLERLTARADIPRRKMLGYFQEQLLATSLFRLYRAIGGDTFSEVRVRRSASDYVVYLIMRAISLLGPDNIVPARTADQFVSALIDADIGTGKWDVVAPWWQNEQPPRPTRRIGGCVHKVIRWAFEQQGLYATERSNQIVEGKGNPPKVDIFIADRRLDDRAGDGGYSPVPLASSDEQARWHAHESAVWINDGKLIVNVGNRGAELAEHVRVTVMAVRVGDTQPLQASAWTQLVPADSPQRQPLVKAISSGGAAEFRFSLPNENGRHWFWVSATCAADRSNIDPSACLPCIGTDVDLADLIANDNNQALCIREVQLLAPAEMQLHRANI